MSQYRSTSTVAPRPSQTKIVATLGPASDSPETLVELIRAGVDVFRLNMAHGSQTSHGKTLKRIREAVDQTDSPVAVLADLAGPKMRLGTLPDDRMTLDADSLVRLVRGTESSIGEDGIPELTTTYEPLIDELRPGNRVLLVDGTVSIEVNPDPPGRQPARRRPFGPSTRAGRPRQRRLGGTERHRFRRSKLRPPAG